MRGFISGIWFTCVFLGAFGWWGGAERVSVCGVCWKKGIRTLGTRDDEYTIV